MRTRSVAVAPSGSLPVNLNPDYYRQEHRSRLTKHAGLRLNTAHAPTNHAEAVDHGGVRIGSNYRVWIRGAAGIKDDWSQYWRFTWCTIPVSGGTTRKFLSDDSAPFQESVPLLISLKLDRGSAVTERVLSTEFIDLNRMVDDKIHRDQWISFSRIRTQML